MTRHVSIARAIGAVVFVAGFAMAAAMPACGVLPLCDCPPAGRLFAVTATDCEIASVSGWGDYGPVPFDPEGLTVQTSRREVVIDYTADGVAFTVVYDVRD